MIDEDAVDLLGIFELALRGAREIIDEQRDALAARVDQHDALLALRDHALEVATRGDGQDVTADDMYAVVEGDELARARLAALFDRALAIPLPNPTTT